MNQLKAKENLHVVFWLLKDFAWLMHFRLLGMAMVLPTIALGIWITVRTYKLAKASEEGLCGRTFITIWPFLVGFLAMGFG